MNTKTIFILVISILGISSAYGEIILPSQNNSPVATVNSFDDVIFSKPQAPEDDKSAELYIGTLPSVEPKRSRPSELLNPPSSTAKKEENPKEKLSPDDEKRAKLLEEFTDINDNFSDNQAPIISVQ